MEYLNFLDLGILTC